MQPLNISGDPVSPQSHEDLRNQALGRPEQTVANTISMLVEITTLQRETNASFDATAWKTAFPVEVAEALLEACSHPKVIPILNRHAFRLHVLC